MGVAGLEGKDPGQRHYGTQAGAFEVQKSLVIIESSYDHISHEPHRWTVLQGRAEQGTQERRMGGYELHDVFRDEVAQVGLRDRP
jgi:hypothetical protein